MHTESVVDVRNTSKSFGCLRVLNDVSLTIRRGEMVGLIGASGSGKSTLIRAIAGPYVNTVIDAPSGIGRLVETLLEVSHSVVVPVQPRNLTLKTLPAFLRAVQHVRRLHAGQNLVFHQVREVLPIDDPDAAGIHQVAGLAVEHDRMQHTVPCRPGGLVGNGDFLFQERVEKARLAHVGTTHQRHGREARGFGPRTAGCSRPGRRGGFGIAFLFRHVQYSSGSDRAGE